MDEMKLTGQSITLWPGLIVLKACVGRVGQQREIELKQSQPSIMLLHTI